MLIAERTSGAGEREQSVSVCMATYNGDAYVAEQMSSILRELSQRDEVIVVDDGSTDSTVEILEGFADPRIKIIRNAVNRGVVWSFERAINQAKGDIIFLSDQDDRWISGRVNLLTEALETENAMVVSSNMTFMDALGNPIDYRVDGVRFSDARRYWKNIAGIFAGRGSYFGCAMAFRRELVPVILPMPSFVESHDLWIALASNMLRSNAHVEAHTLVRRVHGANASIIQRNLYMKLRARVIFLLSYIVLARRIRAIDFRSPSG